MLQEDGRENQGHSKIRQDEGILHAASVNTRANNNQVLVHPVDAVDDLGQSQSQPQSEFSEEIDAANPRSQPGLQPASNATYGLDAPLFHPTSELLRLSVAVGGDIRAYTDLTVAQKEEYALWRRDFYDGFVDPWHAQLDVGRDPYEDEELVAFGSGILAHWAMNVECRMAGIDPRDMLSRDEHIG